MAIRIPPPRAGRWRSGKYRILVALLASLAAIAMAAAISISLAPARITFSIADGKFLTKNDSAGVVQEYFSFVVQANNTSGRTSARYAAVSAEIWFNSTGWVPVEMNYRSAQSPPPAAAEQPTSWQRPRKVTNISLLADHWQSDVMDPAAGNGNGTIVGSETVWPNCTVVLIAQVWFKFGVAQTRPYNVRATCSPVDFVNKNTTIVPVKCT